MSSHLIDGTFLRESFSLRRNQSICSVHGTNARNQSIVQRNPINLDSPEKHKSHHDHHNHHGDRFNNSFHHFRYVVVVLCGLAVGFMSLLRLNITVAILNMVNQTQIYAEENPGANLEEYFGEGYVEVGEFNWSNEKQQLIISYYMIAYTIKLRQIQPTNPFKSTSLSSKTCFQLPQFLTTKLAIKLGVRWSMPLSIAICAISCLLTPILAYEGWEYVTILRLLNGLGASAIQPLMVYVVEVWIPPSEFSIGLATVQFVQYTLFVTGPVVYGSLASIHWKWAFYVPAVVSLIFCVIWIYLVSDEPGDCKLISENELNIICGCNRDDHYHDPIQIQRSDPNKLGPSNNRASVTSHTLSLYSVKADTDQKVLTTSDLPVPWTRALREVSFYGLTMIWILWCSSFGSMSFLIPTYLRRVLKVPIMENGMLCFITNCGCMLAVIWPQPILRLLQNTFDFSLTASRRIVMGFICLVVAVTCLLIAEFHQYQVLLLFINRMIHLSVDTLLTSTIMSQYSHVGISSIVFSLINSVGNFSTVLFCIGVGYFLDITAQSLECWSWVLSTMALMNVIIFIIYSTIIRSEPVAVELEEKKGSISNEYLESDGTFKGFNNKKNIV